MTEPNLGDGNKEKMGQIKAKLSPMELIEAHQKRLDDAQRIPDDVPLLEIADMVVRGKVKLSQQQARVLIELLPYHAPKLTAVATAALDGHSFADLLDRAIERSHGMKLIEAQPVPHPASELKGPMARLRRRV